MIIFSNDSTGESVCAIMLYSFSSLFMYGLCNETVCSLESMAPNEGGGELITYLKICRKKR